jgi:hypothetical protein
MGYALNEPRSVKKQLLTSNSDKMNLAQKQFSLSAQRPKAVSYGDLWLW